MSKLQFSYWSSSLLFVTVALLIGGCGGQQTEVTGTVQLDGKPLAIGPTQRGTVVFQPIGDGAVATGLIDRHGKYRLSTTSGLGLTPGKYAITVRAIEVVPASDETGEPTGRPLTPSSYAAVATSGFSFEIVAGNNTCDLELSSDAGPRDVPKPVTAPSDSAADPKPSNEES